MTDIDDLIAELGNCFLVSELAGLGRSLERAGTLHGVQGIADNAWVSSLWAAACSLPKRVTA